MESSGPAKPARLAGSSENLLAQRGVNAPDRRIEWFEVEPCPVDQPSGHPEHDYAPHAALGPGKNFAGLRPPRGA